MANVLDRAEILNREFLPLRAKLVELAATLDRISRAAGSVKGDPRLAKIHDALDVLGGSSDDRAEQIQLIFSLPYDDQWQDKFFPAGE